MESIYVYVASPAFAYRETNKKSDLCGMMLERSLSFEFITSSYSEAIDKAIAWSKNRFETVIKDYYDESFFSSLKIHIREISAIEEDGSSNGGSRGTCFEWKYDWPGTLEDWVKRAKSKEDVYTKMMYRAKDLTPNCGEECSHYPVCKLEDCGREFFKEDV